MGIEDMWFIGSYIISSIVKSHLYPSYHWKQSQGFLVQLIDLEWGWVNNGA